MIKQYHSFVVQLPSENVSTIDLFLEPFIDLLYDDKCRYFAPDVPEKQISDFMKARYKTLTTGKEDETIDRYQIDARIPNLVCLQEQKVLNLVLQDIISALVENEQAYFGSNTLVSYVAAAVDLN